VIYSSSTQQWPRALRSQVAVQRGTTHKIADATTKDLRAASELPLVIIAVAAVAGAGFPSFSTNLQALQIVPAEIIRRLGDTMTGQLTT